MAAIAIFFLPLFPLLTASVSQSPILPKAAFFPVIKNPSTLQYVAKLLITENLTPVNLVLDLNAPHVWINAGFNPVGSSSLECSMVDSIRTADHQPTSMICSLQTGNTISGLSESAELNEGSIAVEFWDGIELGPLAKVDQFLFPCVRNLLLKGLANDAKGMLGLGVSRISLSSQFFGALGFFNRKISLCLSSSSGGVFLGGSPDFRTTSIMPTPFITSKNGYYITVKSIKISERKLKLPLNEEGIFGTGISTIVPYTAMETKIYNTFVEAFVASAVSMNLSLVAPVAPFGACFDTRAGLASVPVIDLVLQSEMVKWRIHARNSMVAVGDDVMCLGFVDGGLSPEGSIVIGGLQLEDNVLEFDLGTSMLGFGQKTCPGFEAAAVSG